MTRAARCAQAAAFFLASATLIAGPLLTGLQPAMAADPYGCRGDQTCIKIAQTTKCDAECQQQCKALRFDTATCFTTYGPQFEFVRNQRKQAGK